VQWGNGTTGALLTHARPFSQGGRSLSGTETELEYPGEGHTSLVISSGVQQSSKVEELAEADLSELTSSDFALEIGSEELPAADLQALCPIERKSAGWLDELNLSMATCMCCTPRRIVAL